MICTEEKTAMLDKFSDPIQRHVAESVWRKLFLGGRDPAQSGTVSRSVLCVECPEAGPLTREGIVAALSRLAQVHSGQVDPGGQRFAFASFGSAFQAVRVALALQRLCTRARLRMGVVTGSCRIVRAQAEGRGIPVLLESERERAATFASRAAVGTLQMSPETYEALGGAMEDELGSCVLMTEFAGDEVGEISLTLPPDASADLSTFAGLGLT